MRHVQKSLGCYVVSVKKKNIKKKKRPHDHDISAGVPNFSLQAHTGYTQGAVETWRSTASRAALSRTGVMSVCLWVCRTLVPLLRASGTKVCYGVTSLLGTPRQTISSSQ